jgi:hypothetical protein
MTTSNKIKFLKSCIEYDNSSKSILDIFSSRIEYRIFTEQRERLLTSELSTLPIDVDIGTKASKAAYLYRVEKELLYGSFFIVGRNEEQVVCFPLVFFPAEIEMVGNVPSIRLAIPEVRINDGALNDLFQDSDIVQKICAGLEKCFSNVPITDMAIAELITLFDQCVIQRVGCSKIAGFPQLCSEHQLKELRNSDCLTLVAASLVCLVERKSEMRGVIDELGTIALNNHTSSPLQILLAEGESRRNVKKAPKHYIPAILSSAQEKILNNAATETLSVVIGPPGTGKTFTIASVAIDHLSRGETVLISSRRDQAVDVIGTCIEKLLGDNQCVVRGGRKNYLKLLKTYIQDLLNGISISEDKLCTSAEDVRLRSRIQAIGKEINTVKTAFQRRCEAEKKYGGLESGDTRNTWQSAFQKWWLSRLIRTSEVQGELLDRLTYLLELKNAAVRELVKCNRNIRIANLLRDKRAELKNFLKSLRSKTSGKQEELLDTVEISTILEAFPIWLVKTSDISRVLPLKQHLFDLVIIDEATQCDIASCIPLLYRAKRAVVVGDPKQLRHISFLSNDIMFKLTHDNNLSNDDALKFNYRDKSILDVASDSIASQKSITFLNEHFRSHPDIIHFSTETFYNSSLKIMTENVTSVTEKRVFIHQSSGSRNAAKVNSVEIHSMLSDLKRLISEQKDVNENGCYSIGITTPFHEQAEEIAVQVGRNISDIEMKKHSIIVGTPYAFQGEERDIVFISLCADDKSHGNVFNYMCKPDVFNVMITRARVFQHIYISFDPARISTGSLLKSYLESVSGRERSNRFFESAGCDHNVNELLDMLNAYNVKTYVDYKLAGTNIDVVVADGKRTFGIDLIGFPGRFIDAFPLERYLMFKRANLDIYPISYFDWVKNRADSTSNLNRFILKQQGLSIPK